MPDEILEYKLRTIAEGNGGAASVAAASETFNATVVYYDTSTPPNVVYQFGITASLTLSNDPTVPCNVLGCYFGKPGSTPHPGPLPDRGGEGGSRYTRAESERFKCFTYEDLVKRDKVNLDIFWLKDESLEESANLPAPEVIAQEIADDLEAALQQFATITDDLE